MDEEVGRQLLERRAPRCLFDNCRKLIVNTQRYIPYLQHTRDPKRLFSTEAESDTEEEELGETISQPTVEAVVGATEIVQAAEVDSEVEEIMNESATSAMPSAPLPPRPKRAATPPDFIKGKSEATTQVKKVEAPKVVIEKRTEETKTSGKSGAAKRRQRKSNKPPAANGSTNLKTERPVKTTAARKPNFKEPVGIEGYFRPPTPPTMEALFNDPRYETDRPADWLTDRPTDQPID